MAEWPDPRQSANPSKRRRAVIIGAGPAGLTAAFELLARTDILPVVLEKSGYMGGLARTYNYKGNRLDVGGHRFFSKSDRVMQWWLDRLPLQKMPETPHRLAYQGSVRPLPASATGPMPDTTDRVMLVRKRKSSIYFSQKFFDYPIRLSQETLLKLGFLRAARIGCSYLKSLLFPIRPVRNLEQFFINRFGREFYRTFFKSYTEKVWGVPCDQISAQWGEQRIKDLSIARTFQHFVQQALRRKPDIRQKETETSLIEQFLYPKYGPGQMWEEVARLVRLKGGEILTGFTVNEIGVSGKRVTSVAAEHVSGERRVFEGDYFFSTMPIKELVRALQVAVPSDIRTISEGLVYRDFIMVGLLVKQLKVYEADPQVRKLISDNWIYLHEPGVLAGRLQIFNNWSPYLVSDPTTVWLGVEYFCYETDEIWRKPDQALSALAAEELHKIGIIDKSDVLDSTVVRMEKTYPAYYGAYARFDSLREYLDQFENLFLTGRNGMHRYNNQDHSMLTAMTAVDNIINGRTDKSNLWEVNTEMEYHESQKPFPQAAAKGRGEAEEPAPVSGWEVARSDSQGT